MASILFHDPVALMVRIPKTGSTSVVKGIFGGIREADEVHLGPPPAHWMQHFNFAFVRNPFDRLVSTLLMFQDYRVTSDAERETRRRLNIDHLLEIVADDSIALDQDNYHSKLRRHAIPMTHPFFGLGAIEQIYRFESFESSYRDLCQRLNQLPETVPHLRKSERETYRRYYDGAARRRAEQMYDLDCRQYGYQF